MTTPEDLYDFPGDFSLKVMGKDSDEFEKIVLTTISEQGGKFKENALTKKPSKQGTYCSITITFYIESKDALSAIYEALNKHDSVLMVL